MDGAPAESNRPAELDESVLNGPVVELRVWGVRRVGPALGRMAFGRRGLRSLPGVRFAKLLGTGSGRTFTMRDADIHHWAALTVFDDADSARAAADSTPMRQWSAASNEELRVTMRPLSSKGRWSGAEPFGAVVADRKSWSGPVAAITRARLHPTRMPSFWRAVPPVVDDLAGNRGLRLALGVGESPIGLQGTFSVWNSAQDLSTFAYKSPGHVAAIRRTKPERWYAEELFARLAVVDMVGSYDGRSYDDVTHTGSAI